MYVEVLLNAINYFMPVENERDTCRHQVKIKFIKIARENRD